MLAAYSQAQDLSVGELAALLPGMLVYARQAARRVLHGERAGDQFANAG